MSWFSDLKNKVQQTSKDLGVTDKLNQASAAWNEFWDKPMTIQYAHNPYEVVANKGPQEVTQRRGDVVKQVALASSVPALAAGVVTAGVPATISGFTIGTTTGVAGSYGGKKAALFIGLDKNAQELAGNIAGTLTGLYGGAGAANVMANRGRIAYNNTMPFGYHFKRNLNFKGLIQDTGKAFLRPFKLVKVIDPLKKKGYNHVNVTDDQILSRDAAFRKALNIELTPLQKGLYYDRPDGTVGINYEHPLARDRNIANSWIFNYAENRDLGIKLPEIFNKGIPDFYTKGRNGGNIGVKDYIYNPETEVGTFTTFDTWDLQPFQGVKWLPNKIRNIEFVKLLGGKPFTWVDKQEYHKPKLAEWIIDSEKSGGKLLYNRATWYAKGGSVKRNNISKRDVSTAVKKPFEDWYKTVPADRNDTITYNLRRAYELAPIDELETWRTSSFEDLKSGKNHLGTVYFNPDTGIYEFVKSKDHESIQSELDWFYSNDPEAIEFRNNYYLDTSNDFYKYIPKKKQGGSIHIKPENRGKFTEYCGGKVTDECIQRAKRSGNKKLIKRAVFAENARKWKH